MAAAVTSASTTTRIDQIDGCLHSLADLFDKKEWDALPQQSLLDKDTDYAAFVAQFKVKRTQVKGQFDKWKLFGSKVLLKTASLDNERTLSKVQQLLPESRFPAIVQSAFDHLLTSPFVSRRPALVEPIRALQTGCSDLWLARVKELMLVLKANFASTATAVASSSSAFAVAIVRSSRVATKAWFSNGGVMDILKGVKSTESTSSPDHTRRMLLFYLERSLVDSFKNSFSSLALAELTVPPESDVGLDPIEQQTLYYISGFIVSSLFKMAKRTRSTVMEAFARGNSIPHSNAVEQGLPHECVTAKSRGYLIYASDELFLLTKRLEQIYHHNLTTEKLLSHGGGLVGKVDRLVEGDRTVKQHFDDTCLLMMDVLESDGIHDMPDCQPTFRRILQAYMRLRGKDCVKTLMSTIKKSPNSTRSEIAAAIKFASRHANFRTKLADALAGEDCDSDGDSEGGGDLGVPVIGDSDDGEAGGGDRGRGSKKARTEDPGCLACAFGLPKPAGHGCVVVCQEGRLRLSVSAANPGEGQAQCPG